MTKTALYRFFDKDGKLLYVGITERFGQRWSHHARKKPWWDEVHSQTAEWFPERTPAAEAEKSAIRTEKPKYNIIHAPKPPKPKKPKAPPEKRMGNRHKHKLHGIRGIPDSLWEDVKKGSAAIGLDSSAVTRQLWEAWLGRPGVERPPTPKDPPGE